VHYNGNILPGIFLQNPSREYIYALCSHPSEIRSTSVLYPGLFCPVICIFTASGILMVLLAFLVVSLNKVANKFSSVNINIFKFKNFSIKHKKILKYTTIMLLLIFSLSLFCFELYSFKKSLNPIIFQLDIKTDQFKLLYRSNIRKR